MLGEVDLVHDQQVRAADAGAALAGHVAAAGDVQDEQLRVHERGGEGGGEVVAAGLDQHDVQRVEVALEVLDGQQVHRHVIADRGVAGADGTGHAETQRAVGGGVVQGDLRDLLDG